MSILLFSTLGQILPGRGRFAIWRVAGIWSGKIILALRLHTTGEEPGAAERATIGA